MSFYYLMYVTKQLIRINNYIYLHYLRSLFDTRRENTPRFVDIRLLQLNASDRKRRAAAPSPPRAALLSRTHLHMTDITTQYT